MWLYSIGLGVVKVVPRGVSTLGAILCVGEFDVVMCGDRFDKVGIHLDIEDFIYLFIFHL